MRRHVLRFLLLVVVAVVVITAVGGAYLWVVLGRSLPATDGSLSLAGLTQPVTVTRDGLGVPTIRAQSRLDLARATGFVHAQERFFQMDLQRRQPAGELSALVGAVALPVDREMRVIAEGVETQDQLAVLRMLKCGFGQGWLFSKPISHDDASELLLQEARW